MFFSKEKILFFFKKTNIFEERGRSDLKELKKIFLRSVLDEISTYHLIRKKMNTK